MPLARTNQVPKVIELNLSDQVFTFTDSEGWQWHWNASAGMRLVQASGRQPLTFYPSDHGLSLKHLQKQYPDLDLDYAKTTDIRRPILFVPFRDRTSVLADGWHRVARAVMEGIPFLLCHELTPDEAERVLVMKIPPPSSGRPPKPKLAPMDTTKGRRKP